VIFIVDSSLKFDKNISLIVHKAMNIEQILPDTEMFSDRVLLTKAFCTYVRPILEYCSPVWSPHFKYLITKIEHVQRYFTKRLKGCWNMPYEHKLITLCLESLKHRRLVTLVYQILHGHYDTELDATFVLSTTLELEVMPINY